MAPVQAKSNQSPSATPPTTSPPPYSPPSGKSTRLTWGGQRFATEAQWMVLRKGDRPVAEMFYVAYMRERSAAASRPITFVFNGGPGAASAYLHTGALGPKRLDFGDRGEAPSLPIKLVENKESWLAFTDLVFIDPIGTGFSRALEAVDGAAQEIKDRANSESKEFYQLNRDLDSIAECIERILSENKRWSSPVYIAGESYGGFRVGKMARRLQEHSGIGLKGTFLISPALEFTALEYTDYNVTPWLGVFPSLVASSWWHSRRSPGGSLSALNSVLQGAEEFVRSTFARYLVDGSDPQARSLIAEHLQLNKKFVDVQRGRVSPYSFVRELKRNEGRVCGLYDASVTSADPFGNRDGYEGPEPTLTAIGAPFTHGVNAMLREVIGLETTRHYHLLSYDVYHQWNLEQGYGALAREVGATDDLRYGIALNPAMKVHVSHGVFDLITPYFASKRILDLSPFTPEERKRISFSTFLGGHMFYSWTESRRRFTKEAQAIESGK
jgi:carboxypeptidase C (cathepsin A)